MADSFDSQSNQPLNDLALAKKQLRNELRARRRALNPTQQMQASIFLLRHLLKLPQFMRARNVDSSG